MNTRPELRSAFDVFSDVETATAGLEDLARVLQTLVEAYDLDDLDFTEKHVIDLGTHHKEVYSVIYIVQRTLWEMSDKLSQISIRKDLDQENTETTK